MVSNLFRHLNNLLIGMQKKINSLIHPVIIQIILKRLTVFLSEQLSEIGAVDIIFLAKPLECEVIRIMFLNFFLYISENTSGYILAKLGQIVSVLTAKRIRCVLLPRIVPVSKLLSEIRRRISS